MQRYISIGGLFENTNSFLEAFWEEIRNTRNSKWPWVTLYCRDIYHCHVYDVIVLEVHYVALNTVPHTIPDLQICLKMEFRSR